MRKNALYSGKEERDLDFELVFGDPRILIIVIKFGHLPIFHVVFSSDNLLTLFFPSFATLRIGKF